MNNKRKAAPGVIDTKSGEQYGDSVVVSPVLPYYTTTGTDCQFMVSDLLHRGADSAITCRDLSTLTGWVPRVVTRHIEQERRAGVPILANGEGYFLPGNAAEVDKYLGQLEHREREIRRTRAGVAQYRQTAMTFNEEA